MLPKGVTLRIARPELKEKFQGCLIRSCLQAFEDFRPVGFERIGADAAGLVVKVSPFDVINDYTAGTGILAPDFHAFGQRLPLLGIEATWELQAKLLEEL